MWCQRVCQYDPKDSELSDSTSTLSSEKPLNGPIIPGDLPVYPDLEPMNVQDIWEIFDFREGGGPFFELPRSHLLSVPKDLERELENLITCHSRLNTLLKYCLRAERDERAHRSNKTHTNHLGHHFTFSRAGQLQLTATNRRKTKEIIGQADYAIWQGDEATTSGLIIAGTEDYRDLDMAKLRCFAYMSIARSLRKQTPEILYGIVTDGSDFQFMSIDSNGRINDWRPCTKWNRKTAPAIYTTFRLALRHPATPACIPAEALRMEGKDRDISPFDYSHYYRGLLMDQN
ncbi:hypothetical protein ASPVEDRAFT_73973 [Aspergillus versicolor CBS 583.65]|uniref:Fungal-type protein kinase domain-containing protein n=1 Tax=Aspergillus versicolor CBS 583.65 TaxID=1036611 RepID=A0A1L9PSG5_ASPVE|nr:uncharacterized protein ASPVEDRAFT_73973 [Aspergillus versicolor CBS 583.65]OJJ04467.1 hypothetical protein ASPVEDRAFT_73973 [Aspergillus versicolor CBS 583.65]